MSYSAVEQRQAAAARLTSNSSRRWWRSGISREERERERESRRCWLSGGRGSRWRTWRGQIREQPWAESNRQEIRLAVFHIRAAYRCVARWALRRRRRRKQQLRRGLKIHSRQSVLYVNIPACLFQSMHAHTYMVPTTVYTCGNVILSVYVHMFMKEKP